MEYRTSELFADVPSIIQSGIGIAAGIAESSETQASGSKKKPAGEHQDEPDAKRPRDSCAKSNRKM